MHRSQLCSVSQLGQLIEDGAVKILDCSWYLPSQKRDVKSEFDQSNIPGSQFFYIDQVCDRTSQLPHMLPTASAFAKEVSALGISNNDHVVVYDSAGLFSAARVWWMFKVFGHDSVSVLDGGLPAWHTEAAEFETKELDVSATRGFTGSGSFTARLNQDMVANKPLLINNCETKEFRVLDARPVKRFHGQAPEPRIGLASGHMPNSISLPISELIEQGKLKSRDKLVNIFAQLGVTSSSKIITSCGSGVTAAIITLALAECGLGIKKLYDGSWSEWASSDDTTILDKSIT